VVCAKKLKAASAAGERGRVGIPESLIVMLGKIVLFLLFVSLIAALPFWRRGASGWGYVPSAVLGIVFLVVLVFEMMGRI
jgi:hypothetical protein